MSALILFMLFLLLGVCLIHLSRKPNTRDSGSGGDLAPTVAVFSSLVELLPLGSSLKRLLHEGGACVSLKHVGTGGGELLLPNTSLGMTEVLALTHLLALRAAPQAHGRCAKRFLKCLKKRKYHLSRRHSGASCVSHRKAGNALWLESFFVFELPKALAALKAHLGSVL